MTPRNAVKNLGVLTSGGDAQGMNAALRAVVRTALSHGVEVYAIYEGYQGMIEGGDRIRKMEWTSVSGILQRGGTIIGTARSADFRTREGQRRAARNLLVNGIDGLVVIGGDGSLTGANEFRHAWSGLLQELVASGEIDQAQANAHPQLAIIGMVGSIDNDMYGTDMTIGADSALHRITEAIDAISSTADSHQRTFVVEVMGRHCGYLTLMAGLATGANWILIPEHPPTDDNWEDIMCATLRASRATGRRHTIVLVAEGAQDSHGKPITSGYVKDVLTQKLGVDTRLTILGHVQRGGAPSAFDRIMSAQVGFLAAQHILTAPPESEPQLVGFRDHEAALSPLVQCVSVTRQVADIVAGKDYTQAMAVRGASFTESCETLQTLVQAQPHRPVPGRKRLRLALFHSSGVAPGMNTAVRAAVRLGLDNGHTVLAARNGIQGLIDGDFVEMEWMSVHGWAAMGGAELGTNRRLPAGDEFKLIAHQLDSHGVDGLLMIGGLSGYEAAYQMYSKRGDFPAFHVPIVCVPASISNNLPGTQISIGADTALNNIISDIDKLKESGEAWRHCFVVEVMGGDSGYLALMTGLATGAEQVYLPESGISLDGLRHEVEELREGFRQGKRLALVIRNEHADPLYTTAFVSTLLEKEGGELFDVRQTILGHVQRGGSPSPFDRIQATRLTTAALAFLIEETAKPSPRSAFVGRQGGPLRFTDLGTYPQLMERDAARPKAQDWLALREIVNILDKPRHRLRA